MEYINRDENIMNNMIKLIKYYHKYKDRLEKLKNIIYFLITFKKTVC